MSFFSVFVLVVGTLISVAWYLGDSPQFFERTVLGYNSFFSDQEEFEHTYDVSPTVSFSLKNINGSISIMGHNKDNIQILITKRGKREDFDTVGTNIKAGYDSFSLETETSNKRHNADVVVVYQIMLPKNAHIKNVSTINGSINISNIQADMMVKNINGSITIDGSHNSVQAHTVNGKISFTPKKLDRNKVVTLETVNGSIESYFSEDFSAHITAKTLVGTISSDFKLKEYSKHFSGREARGLIGPEEGGNINMTINNGTIYIHKSNE